VSALRTQLLGGLDDSKRVVPHTAGAHHELANALLKLATPVGVWGANRS
jgi:hypothetical protein